MAEEEEEKKFKAPKKVSLGGKIVGEGLAIAGASLSEQWYDLASGEVEAAMKQLDDIINRMVEMHSNIKSTDLKQRMEPELQQIREEWSKLTQAKEVRQAELVMAGMKNVVDLLSKWVMHIWTWIYDLLIYYLGPEPEMNIDKAKKRADTFVTVLGDINFIAGIFDIIGSIEVLGTKLPFSAIGRMIRNISWTFGLGWLSWLTLSPTVQHGIVVWYDKFYKEFTRPNDPPRTLLEEAYIRGVIDESRYDKEMAVLGFSDEYISWFKETMKKLLSASQVVELRQRGIIDDGDAKEMLRKLGYDEGTANYIIQLGTRLPTREQLEEWYRRGLIDDATLKEDLAKLGYDGEAIEKIVASALKQLTVEQLREAWQRGIIDDSGFIDGLMKLGYSEEDANIILQNSVMLPSKTEIRNLYERGKVIEEEMRDWVYRFGYRDESLETVVEAMKAQSEANEMSSLLTTAESQYAKGYIDDADLMNWIQLAGIPEHIKMLRLYKADLRLRDEINDNLRKYYIELYRKDKIDEGQLRDRLSSIIKNAELLEAIIDYEKARKEEKEEVDETLKLETKLKKLKLKLDSLNRQLRYLITVRSEEEKYYTAKLEILRVKLETAPEEKRPIIEKQIEQTEAKMTERLTYLDTKIEQVKNSIAAVETDIEAVERAMA